MALPGGDRLGASVVKRSCEVGAREGRSLNVMFFRVYHSLDNLYNFWEVNCGLCPYFGKGGCGGVGPEQLDVTPQHNCARVSEAGISHFLSYRRKLFFFFL